MAQVVNVIGYGPVEFPDGMSQDEMTAALKKLPPLPSSAPTQQTQAATPAAVPSAPAEKPPEDLTKPAFLAPRQRATVLQERAATIRKEEAQKIPFDALWQDDKNFKTIQDYAAARFGKEGQPIAGETKQDYVNRFATHMKRLDFGNEINAVGELQYLNNAKQEDILKAGAAYDLFKNTAGVFDEQNRGQKGFRPVMDAISSIISSPSTALTLGTGKIASSALTKLVAEKGTKAALTSAKGIGMATATPAVGGATTAAQDVTGQKIELNVTQAELDQAKKIDPATLDAEGQAQLKSYMDERQKRLDEGVRGKQVALAGAIGAVTETAEVLPFLRGGKKGTTSQLDDILKSRKPAAGEIKTPEPKVEITPKDSTEKALEDSYDIYEGRKLLDAQGQPTSVAQMEVRNDLNKRATLIAQDIWKQIPEFAPKATEKVSDAIKRTLESVDTFDDAVFERALASADVTPDEFAKMFRTSAGDAARSLQSLSVVARMQNKLKNIDPAAAAELSKMYGDRSAITSAFSGIRDFGMRLDRELKALMVSQLSTTVRNAFSGMAVVTFGTASEAIESSLYRIGKTAGELATGKPVTGSFTGGIKGVYDDAVRSAFYLGQRDLSSDVTESLLSGTPALYRKMIKTTGEAGPNDLSKAAQIANTFNVAQDAFFRKAMFTSSVEKQLSRVGINMYDVIAQGKQVPFDVLQNAVNEALSGTFSKMPTKGPMFHAVKFVEELGPVGSTVIPFPRFMANAMEWTYKHMPTGVLSGSTDIAAGLTKIAKGDDLGTKQLTLGLENFSKGAVGTAAVYAAYKYRQEHQDTEWYNTKNPDGSTVDTRALFPAAPFLALGDYLVKFENGRTDEFKSKEFLEAMTGLKAPAGTYSWLGDKFAEAQSNAATGEDTASNKVSTFFGEWMGEYLGRALVPIQQVSDIIGAMDRNETLPRDAYQIPAGKEGFASSAQNQLMKRTPVLKQELPVYQPALRETAAFNDNGPLKMLSGIAIKGTPSVLEEEVVRLKVPNNKIFTSTGDKIVDADARKIMAPLVVEQFDNLKKTSFYAEGSQDLQKVALQNLIGWAQSTAKEIATNKSEAAAYAEGKQPRLYEVQYSKLAPELKRVVNETYKQQQGKDLATTKDYATALAYAEAMRALPGYAYGGVVHMDLGGLAAKKIVGEVAEAGLKKGALSLGEIVAKHSIAPVAEQTAQVLATPVAKVKSKVSAATYTPPVEEAAPIAKQMDEAIPETIPAKIEEPLPEIKTELPPQEPSIYTTPVATTNLNKPKFGFDEETRKNTLSSIKVLRQESFAAIKDAPEFAGIDPSAIAVAQGEYRVKTGRELNADNPADVTAFAEFAQGYQKKLEDLREQYKDMPPKILIHGTETERTPAKVKRGFFDPQTIEHKKHMELDVGATSFTSDLRLNYRNEPFGGPVVKNISYTELPYADYMFRRVDMPLDAYTKKDMNTIARAITGDPTVARPLSLPRNLGYRETEDAFVESEKLKIQTDFNKIEKQYKLIEQQETNRNRLTNKLLDVVNKTDKNGLTLIDNIKQGTEKTKEVYETYTTIKGLFKNEFRHTGGAASTKAGMLPVPDSNQTFISSLSKLAKTTNVDVIDAISAAMKKSGSTDKALALQELSKNLKTIQTVPTYVPPNTTPADIANLIDTQTKAANNIRDLIGNDFKLVDPSNPSNTKRIGLAKGGLASRR
jgi:hypothetical protein